MVKIGPIQIGTTSLIGLVIAVPILVAFVRAGGLTAAQRLGATAAGGLSTLARASQYPLSSFLCLVGIPVKITDPQFGPIGGDYCAAILGGPGETNGRDGRPPPTDEVPPPPGPPPGKICTAMNPCPPGEIDYETPTTDCYEYGLPGEAGVVEPIYIDRITGRSYATMAECQGSQSTFLSSPTQSMYVAPPPVNISTEPNGSVETGIIANPASVEQLLEGIQDWYVCDDTVVSTPVGAGVASLGCRYELEWLGNFTSYDEAYAVAVNRGLVAPGQIA